MSRPFRERLLTRLFICLLVLLAAAPFPSLLSAQNFDSTEGFSVSDDDLDTLLAPIALYPDTLLIQVLQAASYPDQISQAVAWLRINSDTSQLQMQMWDASVIAVAGYPAVINSLYQRSDWTSRLGSAFANQSADVLQSVQRLRAKAQGQGNLVTTPQQQVIVQGNSIQIVPVDSTVIYVPQYNPTVVYTQPAASAAAPFIAFGVGVAVGSSMNSSSVDWNNNTVIYNGYPNAYVNRGATVNYNNGSAQGFYGTGARGYGQGYTAQGTGVYGNSYNSGAVAGRTWNGGAYAGTATTNQWADGARTGSYNASAAGPYGSANARGWGYENDDTRAGGFSRSGTTNNGAYNIHGSGADNGSISGGSITASGINRQGDYASKTWSGNDGNISSSGRSGNVFSGAQRGSFDSQVSDRGFSSRYGGGGGFSGTGGFRGGGRGRR